MAGSRAPKVPETVGVYGGKFWRCVLKTYDFDDTILMLLERACVALDRAECARKSIEAEGMTVSGRYGQVAHPSVRQEKDATAQFASLVRQMGLDLEPIQNVGRPPGR